jgi:hypothetical protein
LTFGAAVEIAEFVVPILDRAWRAVVSWRIRKHILMNSSKHLSRLSNLEGVAKHATFKVRVASRFAGA